MAHGVEQNRSHVSLKQRKYARILLVSPTTVTRTQEYSYLVTTKWGPENPENENFVCNLRGARLSVDSGITVQDTYERHFLSLFQILN